MRNHLGTYECKLCLMLSNNGAFVSPTPRQEAPEQPGQRAAKEAADAPVQPAPLKQGEWTSRSSEDRPAGLQGDQAEDAENGQQSLFEVDYPRSPRVSTRAPLNVRLRTEG